MNDYALVEAVAAQLRAVTDDPLASCEVHAWAQVGLENADGAVIVEVSGAEQIPIAIGEQLMDHVEVVITGIIDWADTQANARAIVELREQIVKVLRENRTLTAGGEDAITNARAPIRWSYAREAYGAAHKRVCYVTCTYDKVPDSVS